MTIKCLISGKTINGSYNSTYSSNNSSNDGLYTKSKGTYKYHKIVENFRSNFKIKVKDLKDFTTNYLNGKLSEFDIISFRGKHKVSIEGMNSYVNFLKS